MPFLSAFESGNFRFKKLIGVGSALRTIIQDTFIGANGDDVNGRTPNTMNNCNNWVVSGTAQIIQSNQSYSVGSNNYCYIDTGIFDCEISIDFVGVENGSGFNLTFRFVDSNNRWSLGISPAGVVSLIEITEGIATTRHTQTVAALGTGTHTIKAILSGSSISYTIDGLYPGNYTSSSHQTATKHGTRSGKAGIAYDNFILRSKSLQLSTYSADLYPEIVAILPGNDVFSLDGYFVWDPNVYFVNGTYYLIYGRWTTASGPAGYHTGEIALATASNPGGPFIHQTVLLAKGSAGSWDDYGVTNPKVIQGDDGSWLIYYTGYLTGNDTHPNIGVARATSITGPYTRSANNPIISHGSGGDWDAAYVNNPAPLLHSSTYYIYYKSGITTTTGIGLATANVYDGPFTKYVSNPVIPATNPGRREDPGVWYEGGKFRLTTVIPDGNAYVSAHGTMWYWSDDGITWTQPTDGYKVREAVRFGSDLQASERDQFLFVNGKRKYLYVGKWSNTDATSIGYGIFTS
jgi:hypothetical protein